MGTRLKLTANGIPLVDDEDEWLLMDDYFLVTLFFFHKGRSEYQYAAGV